MGESPRWRENRLWLSDWGAQEIIAVDLDSPYPVQSSILRRLAARWPPTHRLGARRASPAGSPTVRWWLTPISQASLPAAGMRSLWMVAATFTSVPDPTFWTHRPQLQQE